MIRNNETGNTSLRDEWQTPKKLWNKLNEQYKFSIDCCANKENTKCKHYYYCSKEKPFENYNSISFIYTCWMNPPFSKAFLMFEHFFKVIKKGVAIYRCDNMETKIWQEIIFKNANWIFIFNKRISYEKFKGSGSRFPSSLIGIGVKPPINLNDTILLITQKKSIKNE